MSESVLQTQALERDLGDLFALTVAEADVQILDGAVLENPDGDGIVTILYRYSSTSLEPGKRQVAIRAAMYRIAADDELGQQVFSTVLQSKTERTPA